MKWLTILFALYLLTLSCVPCICADTCTEPETTASHPSKKEQNDNCTPFCTFSCCPVCAVNAKLAAVITKPIQFEAHQVFPLLDNNFTSYTSHNIWQPPKLSC